MDKVLTYGKCHVDEKDVEQLFSRAGNKLEVTGQMDVWDTKIYFPPREIFHILRLMLKLSVLGYMIALLFLDH